MSSLESLLIKMGTQLLKDILSEPINFNKSKKNRKVKAKKRDKEKQNKEFKNKKSISPTYRIEQ